MATKIKDRVMTRYITQFKKSIKKADLKQAKSLLDNFNMEEEDTKLQILHELALAPDNTALNLLLYLASIDIRDDEIYNRLIQLITDRAHLNFGFATILYKICDKKQISKTVPLMKHILIHETDPGILAETINAAGKNKIKVLVKNVAEYIYYGNEELKALAVRALERTGSTAALQILEQAAETVKCDQNILDTISVLKSANEPLGKADGKPEKLEKRAESDKNREKEKTREREKISIKKKEIDSLYTMLESNNPEARFKALGKIAEMEQDNSSRLVKNLESENLESENHDLIINTLRIISKSIPNHMIEEISAVLSQKNINPGIQFAVYEALKAFPVIESAALLIKGIDNPAMHIRMSAVKLLDKNLTDFVYAEIKERIESGEQKRDILVQTIIDSKCTKIIDSLINSDSFSYIADNYLAKQAPLSCLQKFIAVFHQRGLKAREKKYKEMAENKNLQKRPSAIIISSLSTVLNLYEKILFSGGFAPRTFISAQDAFEAIAEAKPDLILSDLFLNDMTGINFAMELRELYSKKDLPVIISTRQKDFTGNFLKKECEKKEINGILEFPANINQIKALLNA
ncbi:MAG: response regulator [Thermodesulfobacteriota bacterium]|nr:response regulator [Thermodesulfobacteriota bacterium]